MRYTGGLAGGSWMTALTSDLGNGKFDGGHLVENFENLNPANTLWTKNYNLWSKVDTEGQRFIEFEKWWGGHVNLTGEEIQWIVDKLFVGNRLATGEIVTRKGERIDLRRIRSPIVCFCSKGDNITPPQQALGWIVDLYSSDNDIQACGQTIVYAVHETVGHLGIFVSGGIAKKEHQEFASNVDLIDVLPPGLYEAVMTRKTADAANQEEIVGDWIVRFEPRTLDDVRDIVQPDPENERRFATVRRVSEINLGLYRTLFQPFVRASVNEQTAAWMKKLSHAELPFEIFSERNPLMQQVAQLAEQVRQQRRPVAPDNPFLAWQAQISDGIIAALDGYRDQRDSIMEKTFLAIYSSPALQALVGLGASDEPVRKQAGAGQGARRARPGAHRRAEGEHRRGWPSRGRDPRPALYRPGGVRRRRTHVQHIAPDSRRKRRADPAGVQADRARTVFQTSARPRGSPRGHSEDVVGRPGPAPAHAGGAAPDRPGHRRGDWRTRGAAGTGRKAVRHGPVPRPAPKGPLQGGPARAPAEPPEPSACFEMDVPLMSWLSSSSGCSRTRGRR